MKKLFIAMMLCMVSLASFSQTYHVVYCELVGYNNPFKGTVTVSVDFGQAKKAFQSQALVGEDGKAITFNSMVDAMNWMGEKGWRFEQAYVVSTQNALVYHWLLSKELSEDEAINEGMTTRTQFKEQQKAQTEGVQ